MEVKPFDAKHVLLQDSNLIEASAGTGKTYSIALLALRLVMEKNIPIQEILMVTFTKAAVAELESRVRLFIRLAYQFAEGQDIEDQKIKDLVLESDGSVTRTVVKQRLKNAVLFLDETAIHTIHGFCQRTLNEFAFETQQIFGSGASSESDLNALLDMAVNQFWRQEIVQLETKFLACIQDDFTRADLKTFAKNVLGGQLFLSESVYPSDVLSVETQEKLVAAVEGFDQEIEACMQAAVDYVECHRAELTAQVLKNSFASKKFGDSMDQAEKVIQLVLEDKGKTKYVQQIFEGLIEILDQMAEPQEAKKMLLIRQCNHMQQLALELIVKEVQEMKERQSFLSFDDMIHKLHHAVVGMKHVGLRDALRSKYKAVFIDEFQDTDKLQYEIFSHLFLEAPSILFFIGDPKQSIYAWRKADINTYFNAKKTVKNVYGMNTNYRSSNAVIAAQNAFFKPNSDFDTFGFAQANEAIDYIHVDAPDDNSKGYFAKGMKEEIPISIIEGKHKKDLTAGAVSVVIDLLGDADYGIVSKGKKRSIKPSDIGILVRNNKEGSELKLALSRHGIPAVTIDETKLTDTQEALELLYVLKAAFEISRSSINKALLSRLTGLSIEAILQLDEEQMFMQFKSYQDAWLKDGVYVMLMRFISDFKIKSQCLDQGRVNGERHLSNVLQLLEILHKTQTFNQYAPNELINWLQKAIENSAALGDEFEQRIESDEDAVKILTIHKSKGLEYNIVLAPYLDMKVKVNAFPSFRDPDTANYYFGHPLLMSEVQTEAMMQQLFQENRRLVYVAMTRAKYKAYVFSESSKTESDSALSAFVLAFKKASFAEIEFTEAPDLDTSYRYQSTASKYPIVYATAAGFQLQETQWRKLSYTYLNPEHTVSPKSNTHAAEAVYEDFIFKKLKKGAFIGNLLHSLFENIVFNDSFYWDRVIERSIKQLAMVNHDLYQVQLRELLNQITQVELNDGQQRFQLAQVAQAERLNELEFDFKVQPFQAQAIRQLSSEQLPLQVRHFEQIEGMMNGKIDLFFHCGGRYYILDWKSNFLGDQLSDYSTEKVWEAMTENNYHLQYCIYTNAVCKYLKMRLPDFQYERDFGGVFYLFIRGVRQGENTGIFFNKPDLSVIEKMSEILG